MNDRTELGSTFEALRREAERVVRERGIELPDDWDLDLMRLAHEVEVQHVELELQNEELQRANRELEASRNEFVDLYQSAPVAFVTLNDKGLIEQVNEAASAMLTGAQSFLTGCLFISFVHPEDQHVYFSCLDKISRDRRASCELRLRDSKGSLIHVHLEAAAKSDAEGRLHWRLALVDVTERKQYESELRKARDELEMRVQERTAELEKSNKTLKRVNQEVQDFVYVASHDLQEPLRKIQMFSDLLQNQKGSLTEEKREDYLYRMQFAAERMRSMIDALLDYSRVTTRAEGFEEIDLAEPLKQALQIMDLRVEETGTKVEIGSLPVVEADQSQMIQLFQNLLENAVKFHGGEGTPQVRIYSEGVENGRVRIMVEDRGIGFDEKYLGRIFVPFERLHGTGEFKGTGIGLAICRKIVERHGGTITAKSSRGEGATFVIELPMKQNDR